jgi:hypothetical protein
MRRAAALLACLVTIPAAGCGGDDKSNDPVGKVQHSTAGDSKGAEKTVRGYLHALVGHNGKDACDRLTPEYRKSVVEQNRDYARRVGAKDCAAVVTAATKQTPHITFEGRPLDDKSVDKIPLRVTVRLNGKEQNATVTGSLGIERYELFTQDGHWWISEIAQGSTGSAGG